MCSVDESGHLDDAKQIASWQECSNADVTGSKKTVHANVHIRLSCPHYFQSPEPFTHPPHICYCIASPLTIYSTLPIRVQSYKHWISTTQSLTTIETLQCNVMPVGCQNQSSQMLIQSRCQLYKSLSAPRTPVLESNNGQQEPWDLAGKGWLGNTTDR
jgi:hypothetical protein